MDKKNIKVLIVEDDEYILNKIADRINKFGFKVIGKVNTGEKAIEIVKHNKPDLILMDVLLKNSIDGIETAKIIMKIKEIPVIFVTGCCRDDIIEKTKDIKLMNYLLKPFRGVDLYSAIKGVLDKSNEGLSYKT